MKSIENEWIKFPFQKKKHFIISTESYCERLVCHFACGTTASFSPNFSFKGSKCPLCLKEVKQVKGDIKHEY